MKTITLKNLALILVFLLSAIFTVRAQEKPATNLQTALEKKDINLVKQETDNLVRQNDIPAFETLSGTLTALSAQPDIEIYWTIICGIASFTHKDVMPKIADLIIQYQDQSIGKSLLVALRNNPSPEKDTALNTVLTNADLPMLVECARQLDTKSLKLIDKDAKSIRAYRNLRLVQSLDKDKIIVVRNDICDENIKQAGGKDYKGRPLFDGNFDKIQDLLTELGIPHTLIGKSELEKDSFDWNNKWAIIFNCTFFKDHCCNPEHINIPPSGKKGEIECTVVCPGQSKSHCMVHRSRLSEQTIKQIHAFVKDGGYCFTEDLNIEEIIERAFKGTITHTKFLPEEAVKIMPYPNSILHPYLKFVFEAPPTQITNSTGVTNTLVPGAFNLTTQWHIDYESPDIKILKKDKVAILISSPELAKPSKYEIERKQTNEGPVAVTFAVSDDKDNNKQGGQVLHIMSHFGKQKSLIDEFTMQNLLVNFLEDCAQRHFKRGK